MDVESLKALLLAAHAASQAAEAKSALLAVEVERLTARAERLDHIVSVLRRAQFGRRSERISEDQIELALKDVETQHVMGEDVSERLDKVPARLSVVVTRRAKYVCRSCADGVVQGPAPNRLIEGGLPTEVLVADALVSKYAHHLPLYRQAQMLAREGVCIDRSTLAHRVGFAAFELDDRPWGASDPPAVAYTYTPERGAEHAALLSAFFGVLQVDGYAEADANRSGGPLMPAYCWSHFRRRFCDIAKAGNAPITSEALHRIGELYAIEVELYGRSANERRANQQTRTQPLVEALRTWFDRQLERVPGRSPIDTPTKLVFTALS